MKTRKIIDSFNAATEGFLYVVKTQRNMRFHFLISIFILLLGIYFNLTRIELMILCCTIALVLIAEMVNTGLEVMLDALSSKYAQWVRIVKDISAGSVLIASLNAVIVGYFLFFNNILFQGLESGMKKIGSSNWHISFFILIVIIGLVIAGKTLFHKGTPLRGGMPSGHAAVSFSFWTLVALISHNPLLIFIVFIMAFMIAQSRIGRHYHSVWEVIVGAVIGMLVTILLYRLFTV